MIHETPTIDSVLQGQVDELDELRWKLRAEVRAPGRWLGSLRRQMRARVADSSVAIEGFRVDPDDVRALLAGTRVPDEEQASQAELALVCYGRAMDHVAAMAEDPHFDWSERVIKDLHFDACYFQRDRKPGLWREGPITVKSGPVVVYEAPGGEEVPGLMAEVVEWLRGGDLDAHAAVRAAMAHLHVVSVHPFRDGNGRVSRIVQSLVLARDEMLAPEFNSIEEYLGEHTQEFFAALDEAHGPVYDPTRSAYEWVKFCLAAHLVQARERLALVEEANARWIRLAEIVAARGWNERLVTALDQALAGKVTNKSYRSEADVAEPVALSDLRRLLDAGFLTRVGAGRETGYIATDQLRRQLEAGTVPLASPSQTVAIHMEFPTTSGPQTTLNQESRSSPSDA